MPVTVDHWTELVGAIEADRTRIQQTISSRLAGELPSYAAIPPASLRNAGEMPFDLLMVALRERRAPELGALVETFRESGAQRAREGVPVAELLQTMRIAMEEVRGAAERLAGDDADRAALLLGVADIVLAWRDQGTVELARGHRSAEVDAVWRQAHHREAFVEAVLLGGLPPAQLRARAEAYGLDPDADYHAIRARPTADVGLPDVERALGVTPGTGLVAFLQGDVCGFVLTLPAVGPEFPVGTAEAAPLLGLQSGFRLAGRALETAVASGDAGVHDVPGLGLRAAVLADPDVGEAMHARYIAPFEGRGDAILETVDRYLAEDCRLARTAAAMFLHANTVRYRLGRFEQETGASLRNPRSLAEVWWALERRRLR
jgi:hypothetical protein